MLGKLHQGTIELFRHDPWLAFDLLGVERPVAGTPTPRQGEVEREDPEDPDKVIVRYPDLVLVHEVEVPKRGIVIGVEAQGAYQRIKRWRFPYYQAVLADSYELQTWMVFVSYCRRMSAAIRDWKVGPPPRIDGLLLDVDTVPRLSLEEMMRWPTAGVLVGALHGHAGDSEAAQNGVRACMGLPEKRRQSYIRTILAALSERERAAIEQELNMEEKHEIWQIEKNSGTYLRGCRHGLETGRQEGRRVTLVELIFALLDVRGVACEADSEARLRACEDIAVLERWADRAREVTDVSALFEDA
ncbi:hypothetical protein [Enhygromyxa salina]|uniref:Rpn family recombination-promoting nuclease/putative transposase n=1 Tax=Enhygromyxa salina TaxID=215803 RepID=A0A2S9YLR7_9BACT|nr:hypothetical protein [Enhygromyxa salina]PRQ06020.1 hypothetical protein ENSA7_42820 [Enhygromyxa salina]